MPSIETDLKRRLFFLFAIFAFSVAVHAATLLNGFVYDDNVQVFGNPWIRDAGHVKDILFNSVWAFKYKASNYYRPVMLLLYTAEYGLFGFEPMGWHLVNVIIHALNGCVVFLTLSALVEAFGGSRADALTTSLVAALLFAAHPINTEAVAWVAAVPELTFTLFFCLSLYLFVSADNSCGWRRRALGVFSVAAFFLAVLAKEPAVTLPLFLALYDHMRTERPPVSARIKRLAPYFAVIGIYFVLRTYALGGMAPRESLHHYLSEYQNVINVFPLMVLYFKALILPVNLSLFHVLEPVYSLREPRAFLSIGAVLAVAYFFLARMRRDKTVLFAFILVSVQLLPALYIPAVGRNTFAERYLYLPSVGFGVLFAVFFHGVIERASYVNKGIAKPLYAVIVLILSLYAYGSVAREREWKDDYTLWRGTVAREPDNYMALLELGNAAMQKGFYDEAEAFYNRSVDVNARMAHPDTASLVKARLSIFDSHVKKGDIDEAEAVYKDVLEASAAGEAFDTRTLDRVRVSLADVYVKKGLLDEAEALYRDYLDNDAQGGGTDLAKAAKVRLSLADVYVKKGFFEEAAGQYLKILELNPYSLAGYYNLALTYQKMGDADKAVLVYEEALAFATDRSFRRDVYNNIGTIYAGNGLFAKAAENYANALELDPDDPVISRNLRLAEEALRR